MKRIMCILLTLIFICSSSVTALAGMDYGEEWENYVKETTVSYTDVPDSHWAKDAILTCTEKKWFGGYPDKSFRPSGTITRAEALKVFVVFLGLELNEVTESSFYDVDPNEWYAPYIEAGKDLFPQYTTIQGKTPFKPNDPVTREDTIYALVRALGYDDNAKFVDESVLNMFKDKDSISKGMGKYFTIALNNELVGGYPDSTIRAQASLNRAEFATLLLRGANKGRPGFLPNTDSESEDGNTEHDVHKLVRHYETSDTVEYWECSECGKYFSDSAAKTEIKDIAKDVDNDGTYTIEYRNVPEYANSAQSKFPTSYTAKNEITLGTPTWPGRDFDYWEVVEGEITDNKIVRGTTGNIVLKAHWLNSENIAIPSSGEIVSCIQNPDDGCYYFTYKIGTITKIPVAERYIPKRAGNGVAVELETETTTEISKQYGNTIAKSISTAVSSTESWKDTSKWAIGASLSHTSEVSAGVEFPVEVVKANISAKKSTKVELSGSYEAGYETGGSTENSYSETTSSSTTVISSNKEIKAQTEYYRIPADYPDGYYSYRTTVDADVYAVVKYDTNNKSYYLSTFSVLGNTKESLFYEEAGIERSSKVNDKYNTLEYDVPIAEIEKFFESDRYTVKLDYNNGTGKVDTMQALVGEPVYISTPENSDGAFVHWELNANNSVKTYMGDTAEIFDAQNGGTITLKAKWGECEVSYSLGEGGGLLAVPLKDATYEGNNAEINYTASNFTYKFINASSNEDPYVTIAAEAYLEKDKTYYVHMNVEDTAVNSNSVQLFYAIGGAYTEAASVRFGGDSIKTIKPTATGYYKFRIDNDTKTNITITDLWVSDVDLSAKSVKFNAPYGNLPTPTRVGYSFDGWYYNGAKVTEATTVTENSAHTLVAKWSPDPLLKTSGEYGYYSRDIYVGKELNITNKEYFNVGLNRNALIANGYTKLQLTIELHGYEHWWFHNIKQKVWVYDRYGNASHCQTVGTLDCAVIGEDWKVNTSTFTVDLNVLNNNGTIQIGYAGEETGNAKGTQTEWILGNAVLKVTAVK